MWARGAGTIRSCCYGPIGKALMVYMISGVWLMQEPGSSRTTMFANNVDPKIMGALVIRTPKRDPHVLENYHVLVSKAHRQEPDSENRPSDRSAVSTLPNPVLDRLLATCRLLQINVEIGQGSSRRLACRGHTGNRPKHSEAHKLDRKVPYRSLLGLLGPTRPLSGAQAPLGRFFWNNGLLAPI